MPIRFDADLLTTAEVAELLGRPVGSINRWAKDGALPVAVKLPTKTGANLFRRADVEAFRTPRQKRNAA